ncbi:MAG: mechanosensitive ion channel family protein, partial [Planctomycetes bacterium]|nr:mechanosensitive ion channel family protein [Planctomycetota bacterium]
MSLATTTQPSSIRWITALALLLGLGATSARAQDQAGDTWFDVPSLHEVQRSQPDVRLETPQACMEHFVAAGKSEQWRRCAAALDLRLLDVDADEAAELARQLFWVLKQEVWIDWDLLPDRPDGLLEPGALATAQSMTGQARRGIRVDTVEVQGHRVPINLHRVKAPDRDPVWLFSAHTVENIPAMWTEHGPSAIAKMMPDWARERGLGQIFVWQWIGLLVTLLLGPALGFVIGSSVVRAIGKRVPGNLGELSKEVRWPASCVLATAFIWAMVDGVLGLPSFIAAVLDPLALVLLVAAVAWLVMRVVSYIVDRYVKNSIRDDTEADGARRRLLTQVTVGKHVLILIIALVGLAIVLLQLNSFRAVGLTLLSSAGAMAVILGIAGHSVLGNLIAGLHIALAQPFRIGDSVLIEDQWGRIEEVTYVDVVVRTWDERRLVFPIRYFIDNWFENWSKNDPYLIKPIYLHLDYRADVERIRARFDEVVRADEDFASDRKDPEVLLTDCGDETITVRMTCGAADPSTAWALVNRVRERMIAWLQEVEGGAWLPRRRIELEDRQEPDSDRERRTPRDGSAEGRDGGGDAESGEGDGGAG